MPTSEIILRGQASGKVIVGAVLEAAVRWGDRYLAFVTDDIPQEDTLRIYLFDSTLDLLDSSTIGAMYSTGSFRELRLVPPNILRFNFIGGTVWTLELLKEKVFTFPFCGGPKGVRRPLSFSRYFKVSGDPAADAVR